MQNLNLYLGLGPFCHLAQIHPKIVGFFHNFFFHLLQHAIPRDTVMITLESHALAGGMCEIVVLVSDDPRHFGRREKYDSCIYSQFSDVLNRVVVIAKAKEQAGYLSLDDRVKSEIFCEYTLTDSFNLILNAEFSSVQISDEISSWFETIFELFLKEKNEMVIPTLNKRGKED